MIETNLFNNCWHFSCDSIFVFEIFLDTLFQVNLSDVDISAVRGEDEFNRSEVIKIGAVQRLILNFTFTLCCTKSERILPWYVNLRSSNPRNMWNSRLLRALFRSKIILYNFFRSNIYAIGWMEMFNEFKTSWVFLIKCRKADF